MAGGILNLVANNNAAQNVWLNSNPQVTFFKKVYRRHTPFAREMIPLFFKNNVDFGKSACLDIVPNGDLLHRMFLTFEIPKISAGFLNSKNYDVVRAINQINFKDNVLYKQILSCIHDKVIEYQKLMDIISNTRKQYENDQDNALNSIYSLENKPKSKISITDLNLDSEKNNFILETDSYRHIYQNMFQSNKPNEIPDLNLVKIKLMDKIMLHKKNYFSIYELVKIMTIMDKNIISEIPTIDSKQIPNILLWSNIFREIFPHNDIINSFILKNNVSIGDHYLYEKIHHLQNLNISFSDETFLEKLFSSQIFDHSININKMYHDFGPEFYRSLNDYNSVINLLNTLSKTVPIIVVKPFKSETEYICTNKQDTLLTETKYSTVIDPNYKSKFFLNLNTPSRNIVNHVNNDFLPIDLHSTNDYIYPNILENSYLKFVNEEAEKMFDNIKLQTNFLFEKYRPNLFTSTSNLMFNNMLPLSNIYSYLTTDGTDKSNKVININSWFFYFFKYLDGINESAYVDYLSKFNIGISHDGLCMLKYMIILLKINIEYYMHEISYLLNDLYSNTSCPDISSTMTTYLPEILKNDSIDSNMIYITIIFHRNIVASITEMFEYIYHFISTVNQDNISKYLDTQIPYINNDEMSNIRMIVSLLYYHVYKHFMDSYDNCNFEAPANYFTDNFNSVHNNIIQKYVRRYIFGQNMKDMPNISQNILPNIDQMEFYFNVEMINTRQQQKFYYNVLSDIDKIKQKSTDTVLNIIKLINNYIIKKNDNNITSNIKNDNIYYVTSDTSRYSGEAYLDTPYVSRYYGKISETELPLNDPIPLPSTKPYGVDPNFFDHDQTISNYDLLTEITSCSTNTNMPIYVTTSEIINCSDNYPKYQLFDIDYYRIKHNLFQNRGNTFTNIEFVNEYDLNTLKLQKMIEFIKFNEYDNSIYYWLLETIDHLAKYTNPELKIDDANYISNILYDSLDRIQQHLKLDNKLDNIWIDQLLNVANIINKNKTTNLLNSKDYTVNDLVKNNKIIYDYIYKIASFDLTIGENITVLRDNFVSQYYLYCKNLDIINDIYKKSLSADNFSYMNLMPCIFDLINTNMLENIPNIYQNPNKYQNDINKIIQKTNSEKFTDIHKYILNKYHNYLLQDSITLLTQKDICDMINVIFTSCNSIYRYCLDNNLVKKILKILSKFQTVFLNKLSLFQDISNYFNNSIGNKYISDDDAEYISKLALSKGINYEDYHNYITKIIIPKYNSQITTSAKLLVINVNISQDLDKFFIKSFFEQQSNTDVSTLKNILLQEIHEQLGKYPKIIDYVENISNEYLSYLYFFIDYHHKNNIYPNTIVNPLMYINKHTLDDYLKSTGNTVYDFMNNIIDYVFNDAITNHNRYIVDIDHDTINNITSIINNSNSKNKNNIIGGENNTELNIVKSDIIGNIIEALNTDKTQISIEKYIQQLSNKSNLSDSLNYSNVDVVSKISDILINICQKIIVLTDDYQKDLEIITNKLQNIYYRNRNAKLAWIHKLAHYLVENVSFKCGDDILDNHISDWYETNSQISLTDSELDGYMKMIGHRSDLINFNETSKSSYIITLPLIFYFNKFIASSLPLNASLHTKYQLIIKLRSIDDVTYKQEFSDFIDPDMMIDQQTQPFIPKIKKAYVICEYIFLGEEERKLFIASHLQYIMDELQFDTIDTTSVKSTPIYKLGIKPEKYYIKENGIKTAKYKYGKSIEVTDKDLGFNIDTNKLIPKKNVIWSPYLNKSGIISTKTINISSNIKNIDNYIHFNKYVVKNHFENPTKYLVLLIKPNNHTKPNLRNINSNYFYGEHQWDNFGLYSRYDLSMIHKIKSCHYDKIHVQINNLDDDIFGFLNIINELLLDYTIRDISYNDTDVTKEYFLQILQTIKDRYMNYCDVIVDKSHIIKLRQNILSLNIDYPILDWDILQEMIMHICQKIKQPMYHENIILDSFRKILKNFDSTNLYIDKYIFRNIVYQLIKYHVMNDPNINFDNIINNTYDMYNQLQINLLLMEIDKLLELQDINYDFVNIIDMIKNVYYSKSDNNPVIINIIHLIWQKINTIKKYELESFNTPVKYELYHDVIYQISDLESTNYSEIIPIKIINNIVREMTQKLNEIIDRHNVDIVDYNKYIIKNPEINPLNGGYLMFNGSAIMPENSTGTMWNSVKAYQYFNHSPNCGVNLYTWSLDPLGNIIAGSVNLTRIDDFTSVYHIDPKINVNYPAEIVTMIQSINMVNYLSGMCGKSW
nr:hypothetical protein [Megavirus caiporensis]